MNKTRNLQYSGTYFEYRMLLVLMTARTIPNAVDSIVSGFLVFRVLKTAI